MDSLLLSLNGERKIWVDERMKNNELKERAVLNYIKGHLADICILNESVDITQIAQNIYDMRKYVKGQDTLQKVVLGEIVETQRKEIPYGQLVAVSRKIAYKLVELNLEESENRE